MPDRNSVVFVSSLGLAALTGGGFATAGGTQPARTDTVILRIDDPPRLDESDETNNTFVYP